MQESLFNTVQKLQNEDKINVEELETFLNSDIEEVVSLCKKACLKPKTDSMGNAYFTKKDGKAVAIYKDDKGVEHIIYNRCPHLKCSLVFNEVEKTWDCPCHGSWFDLDGKCIMGPSNYDIGYK